VAYKYLGASMVVDANHPAVPGGLPEGPPSGRLTYAGSNKANAPWHGHPAWGPQGLARESQGRPGPAVANSHGRDAHATPLYDQAGSNVRGPRPADPNANNAAHFRYDAWNRLATIHLDDGSAPGTLDGTDSLLATYRYDGLNRRVMKVTHADANTTTQYMYYNENWQIVEVRRGVNQTPTAAAYKQFVYDIRYIDSPVCRWWDKDSDGTMEPAAGEMQYFTNNGNFNTTALIDANSGGVVERYLYDPYGKVTVLNGASGAEKDPNVAEWSPDADNKSDWDNEILFCGYWYDPETGLYHVRERYYDPITGTWKTRDRILYPDGMNLYEYCRSMPLTLLDPQGTESIDKVWSRMRKVYKVYKQGKKIKDATDKTVSVLEDSVNIQEILMGKPTAKQAWEDLATKYGEEAVEKALEYLAGQVGASGTLPGIIAQLIIQAGKAGNEVGNWMKDVAENGACTNICNQCQLDQSQYAEGSLWTTKANSNASGWCYKSTVDLYGIISTEKDRGSIGTLLHILGVVASDKELMIMVCPRGWRSEPEK